MVFVAKTEDKIALQAQGRSGSQYGNVVLCLGPICFKLQNVAASTHRGKPQTCKDPPFTGVFICEHCVVFQATKSLNDSQGGFIMFLVSLSLSLSSIRYLHFSHVR